MIIFLRILLGLVLTAASVAKLLNMPGFVSVLHSYGVFPNGTYWPAAIVVTATELLLGFLLLWGRQLKLAAYSSCGLHIIYACFTAFMLLSNKLILNCGCFGSYLVRQLSWATFAQNLVLVVLFIILARLARRRTEKG